MRSEIRLTVNGVPYTRTVEHRQLLVDFLREELDLTGTHVGCEHGICGACTVLMNDATVRSCLMFAVQADGADVVTIEGLSTNGELTHLQEAFWDNHGLQCGYCTPGMLLCATELLRENPEPTEDAIRDAIAGVLCRCTGYHHIVQSIADAAARMRRQRSQPLAGSTTTDPTTARNIAGPSRPGSLAG